MPSKRIRLDNWPCPRQRRLPGGARSQRRRAGYRYRSGHSAATQSPELAFFSRLLEGLVCQAIIRSHRERQAREAQMRARFGCCQPPWAREYVRTGRVRQAEREAGG